MASAFCGFETADLTINESTIGGGFTAQPSWPERNIDHQNGQLGEHEQKALAMPMDVQKFSQGLYTKRLLLYSQ